MNNHINRIRERIEPLRQAIINHPVYERIHTIEDLRIFMQFHIYAVWDFMSLLKSLQQNLTCTSVPWFPKGDAQIRHLINEIVAGEEADIDPDGQYKSHFELYLSAMLQSGADVGEIHAFINALQREASLADALATAGAPKEATQFVSFTFDIINSGKDYLQSAIFTFGREDLIPGMFMSIINDLDRKFPGEISILKYYLERHIEVDGDHHSHLALQMTANLCGDDDEKWQEATEAIEASLRQRINLWNGVARMLGVTVEGC